MNKKLHAVIISSSLTVISFNANSANESVISAQLRILETSDIHANIMDYDYYQSKDDITIGLARTASLLHVAR